MGYAGIVVTRKTVVDSVCFRVCYGEELCNVCAGDHRNTIEVV